MIEVRTIGDDEVPAYLEAKSIGFHRVPRAGEAEHGAPFIDPARAYGAFEGGRVVGTARSFPTELTLPGDSTATVAAVTNVTVTSTHRRRGILTEMMRQQLEDVAARGEPLAILIASEAPIYGRFGYGPATEHIWLAVDTLRARFVVPPVPGSVWRCSPEELAKEGPAVYDRFRRVQPGSIERPDRWWDRRLLNPSPGDEPEPGERFFVLRHDGGGEADGFASYRIRTDYDYRVATGVLEVDDLIVTSDEAYAALWHHCTTVDLVSRVEAYNRPPVEPLRWLLADQRAVSERGRADFVWVRLVDIAQALAARTYRVEDHLVLDVRGVGSFDLHGGPDGATCATTSEAADLSVELADLGASYLGGTALWPARVAGRVSEHRAGALARFDRMFLTDVPPWCNTWF